MALTGWGLVRMEIHDAYKAFLGVSWLFLISSAFTLAKTLRDRHEADMAEARLQGRRLARAEAAYRFENETAATRGTILGLSDFSFDGQQTHQFWLRGGLGAEVDVAGGTASMSVNVTTQGDDPTVWLRSGWKVKF